MFKLFHVLVRSLQGAVNRIVGNKQKERLIGMPVYEIDGLTRNGIGKVFFFLDRLASPNDRVIGVVIRFVAQVSRVDYLSESSYAFSSARQDFSS